MSQEWWTFIIIVVGWFVLYEVVKTECEMGMIYGECDCDLCAPDSGLYSMMQSVHTFAGILFILYLAINHSYFLLVLLLLFA